MESVVKKSRKIFGMGHGLYIYQTPLIHEIDPVICPVMRYSPYSQEITEIVRSDALGELINIVQVEPVGYYHFAHSYVRGNWSSEEQSSFSLMTKCCQ
jgi:hypothetical protein